MDVCCVRTRAGSSLGSGCVGKSVQVGVGWAGLGVVVEVGAGFVRPREGLVNQVIGDFFFSGKDGVSGASLRGS